MKLVVITGGNRTGSTVVYNYARKICELNGITPHIAGMQHDEVVGLLSDQSADSWWVIKSHTFLPGDPLDCLRVIYTHRDPLGQLASWWMYAKSQGQDVEIDVQKAIENAKYWEDVRERLLHRSDTLVIDYRHLFGYGEDVVRSAATHIGLYVTEDQVKDIVTEFSVNNVIKKAASIPIGSSDPITQIRDHHMSQYGGDPLAWKHVLPKDVIDWMIAELDLER